MTNHKTTKEAAAGGDNSKIQKWRLNYGEWDRWEFYHAEKDEHYLYVGKAGAQKDHEWFAIPYVGKLTDGHYGSDDRQNFQSREEVSGWVASYLKTHPHGHDLTELHYSS